MPFTDGGVGSADHYAVHREYIPSWLTRSRQAASADCFIVRGECTGVLLLQKPIGTLYQWHPWDQKDPPIYLAFRLSAAPKIPLTLPQCEKTAKAAHRR